MAAEPIRLDKGTRLDVTVTCGVAHWPTGVAAPTDLARDFDNLLRAADQALYRGKETGRDRLCIAPAAGDAS